MTEEKRRGRPTKYHSLRQRTTVMLSPELLAAIRQLNPDHPSEFIETALRERADVQQILGTPQK